MTAPVQFTARLDIGPINQAMDAIGAKAADLSPFFRGPLDRAITEVFREQFDTEGAAYGTKWAGHADLTKRLRARRGHGRGGILRDTNRLWSSFVKSSGPLALRIIRPHEYVRGSRDPNAGRHQKDAVLTTIFGRLRKFPRVRPARPVVPSEQAWAGNLAQRWTTLLKLWFQGKVA